MGSKKKNKKKKKPKAEQPPESESQAPDRADRVRRPRKSVAPGAVELLATGGVIIVFLWTCIAVFEGWLTREPGVPQPDEILYVLGHPEAPVDARRKAAFYASPRAKYWGARLPAFPTNQDLELARALVGRFLDEDVYVRKLAYASLQRTLDRPLHFDPYASLPDRKQMMNDWGDWINKGLGTSPPRAARMPPAMMEERLKDMFRKAVPNVGPAGRDENPIVGPPAPEPIVGPPAPPNAPAGPPAPSDTP